MHLASSGVEHLRRALEEAVRFRYQAGVREIKIKTSFDLDRVSYKKISFDPGLGS